MKVEGGGEKKFVLLCILTNSKGEAKQKKVLQEGGDIAKFFSLTEANRMGKRGRSEVHRGRLSNKGS